MQEVKEVSCGNLEDPVSKEAWVQGLGWLILWKSTYRIIGTNPRIWNLNLSNESWFKYVNADGGFICIL